MYRALVEFGVGDDLVALEIPGDHVAVAVPHQNVAIRVIAVDPGAVRYRFRRLQSPHRRSRRSVYVPEAQQSVPAGREQDPAVRTEIEIADAPAVRRNGRNHLEGVEADNPNEAFFIAQCEQLSIGRDAQLAHDG